MRLVRSDIVRRNHRASPQLQLDKQRRELWAKREELVGMVAEFKMQKDEQSIAKARFPRFVRLRADR